MKIRRKTPEIGAENFEAGVPFAGEVRLLAYQREWIADRSRIKIAKWCRQAGKDFTTSLEAVLDALETGQRWYIVSLTLRQAEATFQKVKMHCQAMQALIAGEPGYQVEELFDVRAYRVSLPGGGEIVALPGKDPDVLAGLTGNVIFTEMALFPLLGRDHWRVVFPLITRGFKLRAISTPRGPETKFAELCRNPQGSYSVHTVDIHTAVAGGLQLSDEAGAPISAEQLRAIYADEAGWLREYLVQEGSDRESLLSWEHIYGCCAVYPWLSLEVAGPERLLEQLHPAENRLIELVREHGGRCVLGWDIADTAGAGAHLSVVTIGSREGDVLWLRGLLLMHRIDDLDYQEAVVRGLLQAGAVGAGDQSGLGRAACQRLERSFPGRFAGCDFGGGRKMELGSGLMQAVQARRLRLPQDAETVHFDLAAIVRDHAGVSRRLQLSETPNLVDKRSHCDIAYSLALMIDAAQDGNSLVAGMGLPGEGADIWGRPGGAVSPREMDEREDQAPARSSRGAW